MEKSNTKIFIPTTLLLFAAIFLTVIPIYFNFTYFIWAAGITMISVHFIYTRRVILRYWKWYASYMFDEKMVGFRKKVEKPRLFFYSIFWPIMSLSIYVILTTNPTGTLWKDVLLFAPFVFLYIVGVLFLDLTWKPKFESRYIPLVKKNLKQRQQKFKSNYTLSQVAQIFDGMVDNGFLEYMDLEKQKNHREQFVEIFSKGIVPSAPIFDLHIPLIDAPYFFTQLRFKTHTLTNPKLEKIFLINGEPIKSGSLRNSKYNAINSRSKSEIQYKSEEIFSKIH